MASQPEKFELAVGSLVVRQRTDSEKLNPNSLRFLFGHIINIHFNGNIKFACEVLSKYGGHYVDRRPDREFKNINEKNLKKILLDDEYITYWHIEVFARFIGVPSGILLIVSRLFSYDRYNDAKEGVPVFLDSLDKYIKHVRNTTSSFHALDHESISSLLTNSARLFKPLREHDQPTQMQF